MSFIDQFRVGATTVPYTGAVDLLALGLLPQFISGQTIFVHGEGVTVFEDVDEQLQITPGYNSITTTQLDASYNGDITASLYVEYTPPPVPEPCTLVLLGTGLVFLVTLGRRKVRERRCLGS